MEIVGAGAGGGVGLGIIRAWPGVGDIVGRALRLKCGSVESELM